MLNQTNILSILPSPTVGDAALKGDISSLGDSTFQNFMKDAVRESSYAREDKAPARQERAEQPATPEQNRVEPKENRAAEEVSPTRDQKSSDLNAKETQYGNYQDATHTRADETTDQKTPSSDNQTKVAEHLKDLNVSPEKIDALLEFLNVDGGADINALLASLVQKLNLNPQNLNVDSAIDPAVQQQQLLSLLKDPGQAVDLLVKAGLTEQTAKNLLNKAQSLQGNQAALKAGEDAADDVLVKLTGERTTEGKADFLSQFSDLSKQGDKPQRQASIEKVLTQAAKEPAPELTQKPLEKSLAAAPKLEESFQANPSQSSPVPPQNLANANPLKGNEGLKPPAEVKVQSVNAVSDSAARASDGAKPVSAETLSARGTTEAKVLHQIINKFSLRTHGSQSEIKIKLDPPSLGTVRMNVSTSGDAVRTVVIAESHAVKQIIENNLTQLRDSMSGQGLKVDSFTVLVGGNEGQAGQQNKPHEGRSHYAGSPYAENPSSTETQADPLTDGRSRIFYGESQSISVMA
ncbi:MAG: hypothetical protein NPINA01_17490 [Nitrospinaceae bacterium]|nr:MAG: hypothetical protein NPINA01_17490 [Nitrospinaceae bacterium]